MKMKTIIFLVEHLLILLNKLIVDFFLTGLHMTVHLTYNSSACMSVGVLLDMWLSPYSYYRHISYTLYLYVCVRVKRVQ